LLLRCAPSGTWDGGNKSCFPAMIDNLLSGLSLFIKFPMAAGVAIGRVQNGLLEKLIRHIEIKIELMFL
jgi:hypothetical protein